MASRSIICRCRRQRQIIDLRDTDKSRYFAKSSSIIVLSFNKKSPRGIRPRRCSPPRGGVKYVTVTQDKSPCLCSERHDEYLFGRAKTGGLGQVTTKKTKTKNEKKMGITRPRPDGGVTRQCLFALVSQLFIPTPSARFHFVQNFNILHKKFKISKFRFRQ